MSEFALTPWRPTFVPPAFGVRGVGRILVGAASLFILAAVLVTLVRHGGSDVARSPVVTPVWHSILKPAPAYVLDVSPGTATPSAYEARYTFEGAREDVLTLGTFDGRQPAIRLRILRRGPDPSRLVPPFAALVREAAQAGLAVTRSALPDLLPTRFGQFEVADIAASPHDGGELPCAGFRLSLDRPALAISGLACGRRGVPLSRAAVGCLIDRLDVAPAVLADDRDLADLVARTASARTTLPRPAGCGFGAAENQMIGRPATTRKRMRRR